MALSIKVNGTVRSVDVDGDTPLLTPNDQRSCPMPVAKIHVLEGRYDKARLGEVSRAVQNALISATENEKYRGSGTRP
jgi:hypothetical protein